MAKYFTTRKAEEDIDDILAYIAADNFDASIAFYADLTSRFEMLGMNPNAGRERPELSDGVRSFPLGNYLIFYRLWAGKVAITRVIHSARDLEEIFS
ncbi:MAG TPA: type II toxin-antitoxin system RelE/ParE family toxin [Pyrinomonadaceae bacterium]|nr:type II toxin-antitoxin system RelE/ParE family toxin [Pyrinomonadaceae bacterium]